MSKLLSLYRLLPNFRGKYRLGHMLFKKELNKQESTRVTLRKRITYTIPNSIENLGKELLINGTYEASTTRVIIRALKPKIDAIFFDIGANIGAISLPVKVAIPSVKIHAFEASPVTFRFLQSNFIHNGFKDEILVNKAIYSITGRDLKFYESEQYGKSSLAPSYSERFTIVKSITIDDYCLEKNIKHIDVVKIDVQGFEIEVLKGMQHLLQAGAVNNIIFEFEDWAERDAGIEIGSSQEYLKSYGYEIFQMNGLKVSRTLKNGSFMLQARPSKK